MAIVDDYASIATELHRIRAGKPAAEKRAGMHPEAEPEHRMRATVAGDLLYRRLVSQRYWRSSDRPRVGSGAVAPPTKRSPAGAN
jgi:hypothetical protein